MPVVWVTVMAMLRQYPLFALHFHSLFPRGSSDPVPSYWVCHRPTSLLLTAGPADSKLFEASAAFSLADSVLVPSSVSQVGGVGACCSSEWSCMPLLLKGPPPPPYDGTTGGGNRRGSIPHLIMTKLSIPKILVYDFLLRHNQWANGMSSALNDAVLKVRFP